MDLLDLKKIGLTEGEIRIYSALLDLGESTRTEIAKKSGISPSKIYDVANRLLEKGVISSVKKNNIIHFSAANPDKLKYYLELKQQEIEKEKKLVDQMLPMLLAKYQKTDDIADIEVFYGYEGLKTAFWDIAKKLSKGDTSYVLGASLGKDPRMTDIFFPQYYKEADKKGYKIKIIFNENARGPREQVQYFVKSPLHEIKFFYQDTFTEFNVYKDNVLIVMLLKRPIVIKVKSKEAADSFRQFFNTIWDVATP